MTNEELLKICNTAEILYRRAENLAERTYNDAILKAKLDYNDAVERAIAKEEKARLTHTDEEFLQLVRLYRLWARNDMQRYPSIEEGQP